MDVDCEGCAGCCVDWHALAPGVSEPERSGPRRPIDDATNFVPLDREEVRGFLEAGLGDALTPRLWTVETGSGEDSGERSGGSDRSDESDGGSGGSNGGSDHARGADGGRSEPAARTDETVAIDGHELAAVRGRPVFYVGLRKPPKPVAPVGRETPTWLPTCAFLDPETLQCRLYDTERYPDACAAYPGYNLLLGQGTECERVEAAGGGQRLRDDEPPTDPPGAGIGPQSLGSKLFAHPDPDALAGRVDRLARGEATDEDRAALVAVAAASSPGTLSIATERRDEAFERALAADSWVGQAIADWKERAGDGAGPDGEDAENGGDAGASAAAPDPALGRIVEEERGAPSTPGWD